MESPAPIKLALIIGSTRPNRFADVPARWMVAGAKERTDLTMELLDLRDWPMPFYDEPGTPTASSGVYTNPIAERWRHKLGEFDGFIATVAEYNHAPTAVLKNAFDSALNEWNRKPISYVAYGSTGGARAVEQLRMVAIELQMAPIKHAVHINREPLVAVMREGKSLDDFGYLAQARTALFDQMVWWARTLKTAREGTVAAVVR